jgi:hypothetical protein
VATCLPAVNPRAVVQRALPRGDTCRRCFFRKYKSKKVLVAGKGKRSCESVCFRCGANSADRCTVLLRCRKEFLKQPCPGWDVGQCSAVLTMQRGLAVLPAVGTVVYL